MFSVDAISYMDHSWHSITSHFSTIEVPHSPFREFTYVGVFPILFIVIFYWKTLSSVFLDDSPGESKRKCEILIHVENSNIEFQLTLSSSNLVETCKFMWQWVWFWSIQTVFYHDVDNFNLFDNNLLHDTRKLFSWYRVTRQQYISLQIAVIMTIRFLKSHSRVLLSELYSFWCCECNFPKVTSSELTLWMFSLK